MAELFETYVQSVIGLTPEEAARMRSRALVRRLSRHQHLLEEGQVFQYKAFIVKGLFRAYHQKSDGTECVLRFCPENTWMADLESMEKGTPSRINIEALEPSEILLWTKKDFHELHQSLPTLEAYNRRLVTQNLVASQERIVANIGYTPEERYEEFVRAYPDIFNRVPLHMVASYLGVSRETLSRIRRAQLETSKNGRAGY
jgi:CRP-like cAMP-binding protein